MRYLKAKNINQQLFLKLNAIAGRRKVVDKIVIFFARDIIFVLLFCLSVLFAVSLKQHTLFQSKDMLFLFLLGMLTWVVALGAKVIFNSLRPYSFYQVSDPRKLKARQKVKMLLLKKDQSRAFPSGHTALFFALGTAMFCWLPWIGGLILMAGTFVGIARIVAGLHWPVDILGGAVLGWLLSFILCSYYF